jgi:hypothetical protein
MNNSTLTERRLATLDTPALTPIVQRALNNPAAEVTGWEYSPLQGGAGGGTFGSAVYRFAGDSRGQAWSLILKVLYRQNDQSITDGQYWKREAHAYQSNWLSHLSGPLVAPCCFGVEEYPEACWLWLEEVTDASSDQWTLAQYRTVAGHLGEFNGASLMRTALPDWPWLSAEFIRQDVENFRPIATQLHEIMHPFVRRLLPDSSLAPMRQLWEERERFLTVLDRVPQTLCHFDAFRRNLLTRLTLTGEAQTVAIDWAFAGIGPIGAELVSLVWVGMLFGALPDESLYELDKAVFESYVDGLRTAGWRGDSRLARLGYTAAIGLRRMGTYGLMLPMIQQGMLTEADFSEIDQFIATSSFIEGLTSEARTLMRALNFV